MKKFVFATLAISPLLASATCMVELQYQGTVLGQNVFNGQSCREAMRECKRAENSYERNHSLAELSCVRMDDINGPQEPTYPAPTGPIPPRTNPLPPPDTYSRYEAMRELEAMENSTEDANENYDLVISYVDQGAIRLRDAVQVFGEIMRANGGGNTTQTTRSVFRLIMKMTPENQDIFAVTAAYAKMTALENQSEDAAANFIIVMEEVNKGRWPLVDLMEVFTRMLRVSGSNETVKVQAAFKKLVTVREAHISVAAEDYVQLRSLENSDDDAMASYQMALEAVRSTGVSYGEAIKTMLDLTKDYGASQTATIQRKFRRMFRI